MTPRNLRGDRRTAGGHTTQIVKKLPNFSMT